MLARPRQPAVPRLQRLFAAVLVVLVARIAGAGEVTSKGTVLQGKITALSSTGVVLETDYGKGAVAIKWKDIEDLKSDGLFQVLYNEDQEVNAPLRGFSNGKLRVGGATATAI